MLKLVCFCFKCMDGNLELCDNKLHIKPWRLCTLEPLNVVQVILPNPFIGPWHIKGHALLHIAFVILNIKVYFFLHLMISYKIMCYVKCIAMW